MRGRWIRDYKMAFHKPEDYMPEFLKPRTEIIDLDDARAVAAQHAKLMARPVPPPEVLAKKWQALAAQRMAASQKNQSASRLDSASRDPGP